MQAIPFVWYEGKTRIEFPSYREAARALGVSHNTIRYYQEKGIHSEKALKWHRKERL